MSEVVGGLLIAIDGIDGAGKTTQCNLLEDWLKNEGFSVIVVKEPSKDGKYAKEICRRSKIRVFNHKKTPEYELMLFVEDRKENVQKRIAPNLEKNKIVIMDRYYFSTIAYQSALGLDADYIKKQNEDFAPIPDITLIIDVSPNVGIERINGRGDSCNSFEKHEYLETVREKFLQMEVFPNIHFVDGDSQRNANQVFQSIKKLVEPLLKKKLDSKRELFVCQ
ncbi:MAG: dTMP kinase [Thermoplasmatales archaeon]|nr:dTMP kinase [Thermoplasmatales archaeon]